MLVIIWTFNNKQYEIEQKSPGEVLAVYEEVSQAYFV